MTQKQTNIVKRKYKKRRKIGHKKDIRRNNYQKKEEKYIEKSKNINDEKRYKILKRDRKNGETCKKKCAEKYKK